VPLLAELLRHLGDGQMVPQLVGPSGGAPGGPTTPVFTTAPIREDPLWRQGPIRDQNGF
jgi:hypothetical protein